MRCPRTMRDQHQQGEQQGGPWAGLSLTQARWVLDAIRKIKSQKQRPSLERISHVVMQAHRLAPDSVQRQLEHAVARGFVLKVMHKGQCSYKDADTLKHILKKKGASTQMGTGVGVTGNKTRAAAVAAAAAIGGGGRRGDLTLSVIDAVRQLDERGGSTLKSIGKFVRQSLGSDPGVQLRLSVKRAVSTGRLVRCGRFYRLPGQDSSEEDSESDSDDDRPQPCVGRLSGKNGDTVGGRNFQNKRRSTLHGRCSICHGTARNNKNGIPEEILSCFSCDYQAHPSCLKYSRELALVFLNTKWKCSQCKPCALCGSRDKDVSSIQ